MAQGSIKQKAAKVDTNAAKHRQKVAKKAAFTKKGAPLQLPKGKFREEAVLDRDIAKAIGKSAEQKTAAKLLQGGGKLGLKVYC